MQQYHDLLRDVLENGQREPNRTGIDTLTLPGATLRFDLRDGFPAVTTKKLYFDSVKGELIGFLRGCTSAADFRELGCKVWDQNANETEAWVQNPNRTGTDDLGRIYGAQWRDWTLIDHESGLRLSLDQIEKALRQVRQDPSSRRIIVSAWNPGELDEMALPPCHVMFQLLPRSDGTLHMTMYQRSCDLFLGLPFNIASYALLLELFAAWTGRTAATLTMFLADVHIYETHMAQVKEQLTREEYSLPRLRLDLPLNCFRMSLTALLDDLRPDHITLRNYQSHPALPAPMAV